LILRWARERAGLSIDAAASAIGRPGEALRSWEEGESTPTYRQLADLAHRVYKRPIAVFFFPEPPQEAPITSRFRTLPDSEREALDPDTLYALRDARALQLAIPALLLNIDTPLNNGVAELRARLGETAAELATRLRGVIGVSVATQRGWQNAEKALKEWRRALEQFGVFVFKRPFAQDDVSGFCLDDELYPVLMLNNSTSHTRQIFTLFHELAHLAFRVSGVTTRHQTELGSLAPEARDIEVACNRFAADFLVPWDSAMWAAIRDSEVDSKVEEAARALHVSREVVLRRLLDAGRISPQHYEHKVEQWREDYLRAEARSSGGSYYANQGTYLSDLFVRAALYQYHAGRLSIGELADHFRMKAQNVGRFEDFVLGRGASE
jgi:Zn-dependent peptidase ImmA (M78 family)/transcriptional regulator with XRE-family HTH domain